MYVNRYNIEFECGYSIMCVQCRPGVVTLLPADWAFEQCLLGAWSPLTFGIVLLIRIIVESIVTILLISTNIYWFQSTDQGCH